MRDIFICSVFPHFSLKFCARGASVLSPAPVFQRVTGKQSLCVMLNLAVCACLSESKMGIFVVTLGWNLPGS